MSFQEAFEVFRDEGIPQGGRMAAGFEILLDGFIGPFGECDELVEAEIAALLAMGKDLGVTGDAPPIALRADVDEPGLEDE